MGTTVFFDALLFGIVVFLSLITFGVFEVFEVFEILGVFAYETVVHDDEKKRQHVAMNTLISNRIAIKLTKCCWLFVVSHEILKYR